ncbi:hypothetical protein Pcinc_005672 [Petrolisthes cinctipes]|uniref:Uncharacterized protein n=1 Tax=Petrolisthes cinctipes TaxID=88211 RepID=A0AAE1GIW3_PETCI|nr:hypothetical protein Pcinc_005672 [Petrolisthes cinctipes]
MPLTTRSLWFAVQYRVSQSLCPLGDSYFHYEKLLSGHDWGVTMTQDQVCCCCCRRRLVILNISQYIWSPTLFDGKGEYL